MPRKVWANVSILAGGVFNPLDGWDYEFLPWPARVNFVYNATLVGLLATVVSGSDRLQEDDAVPAGGVAGTVPTPFNAPELSDEAAARDRLKVSMRNPTAGTIITNGYTEVLPL